MAAFLSAHSGGILQLNLIYLLDELQTPNFEHSSELDDNALLYKNIYIITLSLYFINRSGSSSGVKYSVSPLGNFEREKGGGDGKWSGGERALGKDRESAFIIFYSLYPPFKVG